MPPSSPTKHPRGAPKGNVNAVKHGFYTRRLHKRDLIGVESTDVTGLIEEIALIRVFTRRLLESIGPDTDAYELAEFLRALCLASSTLTRIIKTQFLIAAAGPGMDNEISEAIKQVNAEFASRRLAYQNSLSSSSGGLNDKAPIPTPEDEIPPVGTTFDPSIAVSDSLPPVDQS
jgi:hypothetical protein